MTNIEKTDLYQELLRGISNIPAAPPDLAGAFERLRAVIRDAEKYIVISFPEFTPHDHVRHLDGLFALADRVIGHQMYTRLGATELVLLAFGLYSHDWGMAVTEAERQFLFDGAPAQAFECLPDEPLASTRFVSEATATGIPRDVAWRDYIRRTHGLRSGARLRKHLEPFGSVFADAVAKIAEGHTLEIRDVRDASRYPLARSVFGETVNIAALTVYVRIIDLLDLGDDRTPYALWKFVAPLNELSSLEWQKHRALSPIAVNDTSGLREIVISGWTDDAAVFSALADLRAWVDSQFAESIAFLRTTPSKYLLAIDSHLNWSIEAVGFRPLLVKFECQRAEVLALLSSELYKHDPLAFVRELLQNSVDAIDARAALSRGSGTTLHGEIRVDLRSTPEALHLTWEDNGIGMDENILSSYFSSIGRSWYKSREASRLADVHPISQFGIGVLSFFSVSRRITIATRRDPQAGEPGFGMFVEIPARESYFRVQPAPDLAVGTRIRLEIPSRTARTISSESITEALSRICRYVQHGIRIESDGVVAGPGGSGELRSGLTISIKPMRGDTAGVILDSCNLVDFDFGNPAEGIHGHYSAIIPKNIEEFQGPVGHREWLIRGKHVDFDDIIVDTEQSLFTKGIQVGRVSPGLRPERSTPFAARHTDWVAPKILVNLLWPSDLQFSLDRSSVQLASDGRMNSTWSEIASKLKACTFNSKSPSAADTAASLGTCAVFGGIPDIGLRALTARDDTPLLILLSGGGLAWRFLSEMTSGTEFWEAPYELGYAIRNQPRKIDDPLVLAGWGGQDALFPSEGCDLRNPPYLRDVLRFGEAALAELGWRPVELRLVTQTRNETVPLVCRVWRKLDTNASRVSGEGGNRMSRLRTIGEYPSPQLLQFPAGVDQYAAIGSRYWNIGNTKIQEINRAINELTHRYQEGKLSAEKSRLVGYLTSSSFCGYKVPSRVSGATLAIDCPNRLLEIAQSESLAGSIRLTLEDFFPGTVAEYSNPYHYSLRDWDTRETGLGCPLEF